NDIASTPDGVAKPERLLLAGEARTTGGRQVLAQLLERCQLAAVFKRRLELELAVEMVLDNAFVSPGDEDKMLDTCFTGFIDGILDERSVHDRKHFLGHRFRCRKEPGSQTSDRKNGSTDSLGHKVSLYSVSSIVGVNLNQYVPHIVAP